MAKTVKISIASYGGKRVVVARPINEFFAMYRDHPSERWTLTHLPTGFSAGTYKTIAQAKAAATKLLEKFGPKRWQFTEPEKAKALKGAKHICQAYGGYR